VPFEPHSAHPQRYNRGGCARQVRAVLCWLSSKGRFEKSFSKQKREKKKERKKEEEENSFTSFPSLHRFTPLTSRAQAHSPHVTHKFSAPLTTPFPTGVHGVRGLLSSAKLDDPELAADGLGSGLI